MQQQVKNLLKGILVYGFGNVSVKLVGLVLLKMYTNTKYLSVEEYGVFGVLEVSTQVIVSLFSLALYTAYIRWYWDKDYIENRKSILFSCIVVLLLIGSLITASGFLSSKVISEILFNKDAFALPIALMITAASLQFIIDITLSQMRVEEKPGLYITSNITRLTLTLIATVYLLKYKHRGVVGIQQALVFGNVAFIIITLPYILKRVTYKFNWPIIKEMLRFSLPLALASISGVLLNVFDRYVLNFKSTLLNVGLYTLAFKIANTTKIFIISSIQIALTPVYFKIMNRPDHKEIYSRLMIWLTIVVVYAALFLSLFGLEITKLFASGTIYYDAYKLIPLISLGIIFAMLKDSTVIGLQIVKRTNIIGLTLFGIAIFNLLMNILLIPVFEIYGAALSSLLSQIIFFIIIFLYAQKHYRIPYRIDKVFIILSIGVVLYYLGSLTTNGSLGFRILIKSVLLAVFPLSLFVFRVFEIKEIELIKSFIGSIKSVFSNSSSKDIEEGVSKAEEV